jgi:hypothetical protein
MGMESVAWFVAGWTGVALVVSLILGRMLQHTTTAMDDHELNEVVTRRQVLRYLRHGKPAVKTASPAVEQAVTRERRKAR